MTVHRVGLHSLPISLIQMKCLKLLLACVFVFLCGRDDVDDGDCGEWMSEHKQNNNTHKNGRKKIEKKIGELKTEKKKTECHWG